MTVQRDGRIMFCGKIATYIILIPGIHEDFADRVCPAHLEPALERIFEESPAGSVTIARLNASAGFKCEVNYGT